MIMHFEAIASTNAFCKNGAEKLPDSLIVWATEQSNGYGKPGNRWFSIKNQALIISVLFKGKVDKIGVTSLNTAKFVKDILFEHFGLRCFVKVPNDIYTKNGKLAGILTEIKNNAIIIGIGLNVKEIDIPGSSSLEGEGINVGIFDLVEEMKNNLSFLRKFVFLNEVVLKNEELLFFKKRVEAVSARKRIQGVLYGLSPLGFINIDNVFYSDVKNVRLLR